MNLKKFFAVSISCVTLVSFTACDINLTMPKEVKNYIDIMEDVGFVEYSKKSDIKKKGAYQISKTSSNIENVIEGYEDDLADFDMPLPDPDDLTIVGNAQKIQDSGNHAFALMFVFEDEDDAEDLMDDYFQFYDEIVEDSENYVYEYAESDYGYDSNHNSICFAADVVDYFGDEIVIGITAAREDNVVYLIMGYSSDADMQFIELADDICDGFGFYKPGRFI